MRLCTLTDVAAAGHGGVQHEPAAAGQLARAPGPIVAAA
jgi:hypothetical protein